MSTFGSMPEKISTVSRLLKEGFTVDDILLNTTDECNTLYDTEWNLSIDNNEKNDLVGYLCFSKNKLDISSLSICLNISVTETSELINHISFIETIEGKVDFVSYGFKNYCKKKLEEKKIYYIDNLISLIKIRGELHNFGNLADYYIEKGDNKEILSHLDDNHLIETYSQSLSINDLHENVNIALEASRSENISEKITKYAHLKCALVNISTSPAIVSELKCYLTENEIDSARELIGSANSNEEKLQLYCLFCIHEKEKGVSIADDIKEKIDFLYNKIKVRDIGHEKAIDIAADLFPIFPEKAIKLINDIDELDSSGQNKSDYAFLKLSMIAFKRHGDSFHEDSDEFFGVEDKRASMLEAIDIFNPDSPAEKIIEYIDSLEESGDKIFFLRAWLKQYYMKSFSIKLLDKAIALISETIDFSVDASLFSDISRPLCYANKDEGNNSYQKIMAQINTIREKGPTINFCKLTINIYKFESKNKIKTNRLDELIKYILSLSDDSVSLASLSVIDEFAIKEELSSISKHIKSNKKVIAERLLNSDAYHVDVFKDAIKIEATYNIYSALAWADSLNSKPRRDYAKSIALKSYLNNIENNENTIPLSLMLDKLRSIGDETYRETIYKLIINKFKFFTPSKNDYSKLIKTINRIENNIDRLKCYVNLLVKAIELGLITKSSDNLIEKIKHSHSCIDGVWNKIELAFYVHEKLNFHEKTLSEHFKKLAVSLCEDDEITNKTACDYISTSLDLSIRELYVLIKNKIDTPEDLDIILLYLDLIPSKIHKVRQLSRLASAFQKNSRLPEVKRIIDGFIIPILDDHTEQPSAEYTFCARYSLPVICVYNFDIFSKYYDKISNKNGAIKETIISNTIDYIYNDCLFNDPYKPLKDHKYNIGYSDLTSILKLISLIKDDSSCIFEIRKLLDVIDNLRKSNKISGIQINEFIYPINLKMLD